MARRDTADGAAVEALAGILRGESVLGLSEAQLLERFVARRDGPAFAALMARYGPLVMGVCRRGLDDESEAEDAFQATFLVLVRRAGDIRHAERLGPWLFAVARKVTARARQQARARKPSPAEPDTLADPSPGVEAPAERSELKAIVDGEVAALPDTLRRPVVLCYLDGLTHDEAALRLRWPVGTVRSRLARARSVLRTRLARRGVVAGASALAVELAPSPVSASLIERTVRACLAFTASPFATKAAGTATASLLASGVLRTMLLSKWITLTTAALTLGGTATISSLLIAAGPQGGQDGAIAKAPAQGPAKPSPLPTEKIREALGKKVDLTRKNEVTTLENFLKQVAEATRSEAIPQGISILFDPMGLSEAKVDVNMTQVSPIGGDYDLAANLGFTLRAIGLSYYIKDGHVLISSTNDIAQRRFDDLEARLEQLAVARKSAVDMPSDQAKTVKNPEKQAETPASTGRESEPSARTIGDVLYIISADGRKIVAKNAGTGATHTVTIGKPGQDPPIRTRIIEVLGGRFLGLRMEGRGIDKLVVGAFGKLVDFPLPKPVEGTVAVEEVKGNSQSLYYLVGRRLYLATYMINAPREENGFEWVSHDVPEGLGELQSAEVVSTSVPFDSGGGQMMSVARQVLQFRCRKGILNYDPYEKKWTTLDFDAILKEAK